MTALLLVLLVLLVVVQAVQVLVLVTVAAATDRAFVRCDHLVGSGSFSTALENYTLVSLPM